MGAAYTTTGAADCPVNSPKAGRGALRLQSPGHLCRRPKSTMNTLSWWPHGAPHICWKPLISHPNNQRAGSFFSTISKRAHHPFSLIKRKRDEAGSSWERKGKEENSEGGRMEGWKGEGTAECAPRQPSNPWAHVGSMLHTQPPITGQEASQAQPVTSAVDTPLSGASSAVSGKALETVYLGLNPRPTALELCDLVIVKFTSSSSHSPLSSR